MKVLRRIPEALEQVERHELEEALGLLAQGQGHAIRRMAEPEPAPPEPDRLIDVEEAADLLGFKLKYLYRHAGELPFTRRAGRRLLFSFQGIQDYIRGRG